MIRAKLNNATMKDKLSGTVDLGKVDTDLRSFMSPHTSPCKILISPDDEQSIKADKLTTDQKNALWGKIMAQMHGSDNETLGNISLQPISDEEMEGDFSEDDNDDCEEVKKAVPHGDKDERVPPLHVVDYQKSSFYNRTRQHSTWRGGRRAKYFDGSHNMRPGPRPGNRPEGPWLRNVNGGPWRPMGPTNATNFPRVPLSDNSYISQLRQGEQAEFLQESSQEASGRSGKMINAQFFIFLFSYPIHQTCRQKAFIDLSRMRRQEIKKKH